MAFRLGHQPALPKSSGQGRCAESGRRQKALVSKQQSKKQAVYGEAYKSQLYQREAHDTAFKQDAGLSL